MECLPEPCVDIDDLMQAAFKDYVTAIVLRQNTITDTAYRDDPTILAWDLVNEPANPGDETGNVLHVSTFLTRIPSALHICIRSS